MSVDRDTCRFDWDSHWVSHDHTARKVRVGEHAICLACLDVITALGFVHPAAPTPVREVER